MSGLEMRSVPYDPKTGIHGGETLSLPVDNAEASFVNYLTPDPLKYQVAFQADLPGTEKAAPSVDPVADYRQFLGSAEVIVASASFRVTKPAERASLPPLPVDTRRPRHKVTNKRPVGLVPSGRPEFSQQTNSARGGGFSMPSRAAAAPNLAL